METPEQVLKLAENDIKIVNAVSFHISRKLPAERWFKRDSIWKFGDENLVSEIEIILLCICK